MNRDALHSTDFDALALKIASPEDIMNWSFGEVIKPETINYRTQRPEKDGLFSERIFGPTKDWECYCGKYRRIRYKGITCDRCGVEVTRSIVRRERMGHITLAAPVAHTWFLRSSPSKLSLVLDVPVQKLEKVVYYVSHIIVSVNEANKARVFKDLEKEFESRKKTARKEGVKTADLRSGLSETKKDIEKAKSNLVVEEKKILTDAQNQKEEILKNARRDAEAEKRRIIEKANRESKEIIQGTKRQVERDRRNASK